MLLRALPDRFEEILLFFLQRLLARGAFLLLARRRRTSRRPYVRQFLDRATIQRYHIKITRPRERDAFFIVREVWIRLRVLGLGYLPSVPRGRVVKKDIAIARIYYPLLVLGSISGRRWRRVGLGIR